MAVPRALVPSARRIAAGFWNPSPESSARAGASASVPMGKSSKSRPGKRCASLADMGRIATAAAKFKQRMDLSLRLRPGPVKPAPSDARTAHVDFRLRVCHYCAVAYVLCAAPPLGACLVSNRHDDLAPARLRRPSQRQGPRQERSRSFPTPLQHLAPASGAGASRSMMPPGESVGDCHFESCRTVQNRASPSLCWVAPARSRRSERPPGGWVIIAAETSVVLVFIDLRDRAGIVRVSFDPDYTSAQTLELARSLGTESVVLITGEVVARPAGDAQRRAGSGTVEVRGRTLRLVGPAETPVIPSRAIAASRFPRKSSAFAIGTSICGDRSFATTSSCVT